MLGRHGNNLYWMSRYIERSENNARRVQAVLHHALGRQDEGMDEWLSLIAHYGHGQAFAEKYNEQTMANVVDFLLRDKTNPDSVASLMANARQNGRAVRTALSREAWQSLNESWIYCDAALKRPVRIHELPTILQNIIKNSESFRGTIFGTMLRNDVFNFLRAGTFIERSDNTARMVGAKYHRLLPLAKVIGGGDDHSQWEIMLRALAAWSSFNRLNKGRVDPAVVAEFLIFDARMPRSLNLCYREIVFNLSAVSADYGREYPSLKLAEEIRATLDNGRGKSANEVDLKDFITSHIHRNNNLSFAIGSDFNFD